MELVEASVPRTLGGYRRALDSLKWRCEGFEMEVVEIMSERQLCLAAIRDLETTLAGMASEPEIDFDREAEEEDEEGDELDE